MSRDLSLDEALARREARKRVEQVKVGCLVVYNLLADSADGHFGVVTEIFEHGGVPDGVLYHVHKIDLETGELLVCPDRKRCKNQHTCPIHGWNLRRDQISPPSRRDVEFYVQQRLLSPLFLKDL